MRIGFTGTQEGMTPKQRLDLGCQLDYYLGEALRTWDTNNLWFHHGDCIGADADAQTIADDLGYCLHVHPPVNDSKRAFCEYDKIEEPKPYLDRNHDIVDACDVLIAAPKTLQEEQRSGTWATVRYARRTNKPVIILEP